MWKKIRRFWRGGLAAISVMLLLTAAGCGTEPQEQEHSIPDSEREEAKADCRARMEEISDIYRLSDSDISENAVSEAANSNGAVSEEAKNDDAVSEEAKLDGVISGEALAQMKEVMKRTGNPVISSEAYSDMENYKKMDSFLRDCMNGKSSSVILYEIFSNGDMARLKYFFNGSDMSVLAATATWNEEDEPEIASVSYMEIKEWEYTDKGWFCYQMCVPKPPEVTEIIDGSCLFRVKPMDKEQREMSLKCVKDLGYQGNNLLCSDWDKDHLEELDFNGLFEYLYKMNYGSRLCPENYTNGVPKTEFEDLIMEYLPVTRRQIRKYAVFDEKNQVYPWQEIGCSNYTPSHFGASLPEVVGVRKNDNGTVTLTVDAVCDSVVCDDAVITHELTVQFSEDGSFRYLGNKILGNGTENIPDYQYRVNGK